MLLRLHLRKPQSSELKVETFDKETEGRVNEVYGMMNSIFTCTNVQCPMQPLFLFNQCNIDRFPDPTAITTYLNLID